MKISKALSPRSIRTLISLSFLFLGQFLIGSVSSKDVNLYSNSEKKASVEEKSITLKTSVLPFRKAMNAGASGNR